MFRAISDFRRDWAQEVDGTLKVLRTLTEASLAQPVAPGGRTLGRIAWHVVGTLREMMEHAGLRLAIGPTDADPQPPLADMIRHYDATARALAEAVSAQWSDAMLGEEIPMYGERWPRGRVLSALIKHQAHHRGQMTVLMRQAGLSVPGIYGPSREEWIEMGREPEP